MSGGERSAAARSPWFGITGIVLLATLVATIVVQTRQSALLQQALAQDDYVVLNLYQTEIEYLRLREPWAQAVAEPQRARELLTMRYDIFVSRVALLRTERAAAILGAAGAGDVYASTLRSVDGFIARADNYLASGARNEPSTASMAALQGELRSLDEPIHQMLLGAAHRVAEHVTQRREAIRRHNAVGIALVGSLLALVLAFASLALRRLRQVRDAQRAAEALAQRLDEARGEALRASQAKSELLANMSHEIRTPFHGMLGMLSLLQETRLDARQAEFLASASESGRHLLALLNDVLDLSRLEAGTLQLLPQALDLAALVRGVEHSARPLASAKGLALRTEIDADAPGAVQLDGTRLRQILLNVLHNAIRSTDAGSVSLHCRVDRGAEPAQLEFTIRDTGVGLDAAALEGVFERFGQIDSKRARRQQGSGLGLEIARKLARLMQGDLEATSRPGEGSVFTLRLPLQLPGAAAVPVAGAAATAGATSRRPLEVLVAEDHPVNTQYMAALLQRLGHHATFVANGWQAVDAVERGRFDLVLMDVHMPMMDGIVATSTIRAAEDPATRVPIVGLSADTSPDTRERCLAAGMHEVLAKPLTLDDMKALLIRHFGTAAGAAGGGEPPATPTDAAPLLDRALLARLFELMSRDESSALYATLFTQAREASQRMHAALREADAPSLKQAAHGIKGAALNLGARALADAADRIHQRADGLEATQLALALQRYDETLAATRDLCATLAVVDADR